MDTGAPEHRYRVHARLAHTIIADGKHDQAFLARYCTDFEPFRKYVMGEADGVAKTAQWAAAICDVPAESITTLARRMAASRTMISVAWALQRGDHGEQPYWMGITLAACSDRSAPPAAVCAGVRPRGHRRRQRVAFSGPVLPQGRNSVRTAIPVARITDMLENPDGSYDFDGTVCTYPTFA